MSELLDAANAVAARLSAHGATAVALVGSVARGDTHARSDVDITAIGEGPAYVLEMSGDVLVSISWKTAAMVRELFDDPMCAGGIVPSWRTARLLQDAHGIGAALQSSAHSWDWGRIASQCDRAVANMITGLVEEVFRIVGLRGVQRFRPVAVFRGVVTRDLSKAMAIHDRLMYDSENVMWDLVASVMGHDWERDFDIAVGLRPGDGDLAALSLYRHAATRADRVLTNAQREVVHAGLAVIDHA